MAISKIRKASTQNEHRLQNGLIESKMRKSKIVVKVASGTGEPKPHAICFVRANGSRNHVRAVRWAP